MPKRPVPEEVAVPPINVQFCDLMAEFLKGLIVRHEGNFYIARQTVALATDPYDTAVEAKFQNMRRRTGPVLAGRVSVINADGGSELFVERTVLIADDAFSRDILDQLEFAVKWRMGAGQVDRDITA